MFQTILILLTCFIVAQTSAKPSANLSLISVTPRNLADSNAPAYWNADCGGKTYVGSYTVMMEWADCNNYCKYFPHASELGHTFTFADILDSDTMECLRFNMMQQYTPNNGFAGHYWAGGYRGGDGNYRWSSGEPFDYHDFVGNPGNEPYVHLTPGNNYQWNTKSDQNDRNNGCLCKSEQPASEREVKEPECLGGWVDLGPMCVRASSSFMHWGTAREHCQDIGGDLAMWRTREEFTALDIFWREWGAITGEPRGAWTQGNDAVFEGDFVWGDGPELMPMHYGWREGHPLAGVQGNDADYVGFTPYNGVQENIEKFTDLNMYCQIWK